MVSCSDATTTGDGRTGIEIAGNSALVEKCSITSGAAFGTGNGGHGIWVTGSAINTRLRADDILATGTGYDSGSFGGDGIRIDNACLKTEVRECTIANTGYGVAQNGFAINNDPADDSIPVGQYTSIIYNNFAYNIANSEHYNVKNKNSSGRSQGASIITGTPGLYDNVYV